MPFSSRFSHFNQIGQIIKDMFEGGMPHHHVVKLKVILVTKTRVFLTNKF
jgi:hypothetical protein